MSFSVLFSKSEVRYDREILKLRVAQIERRIWLVTLDVANILVTASRIGSQLAIKSGDAKPRRVTQWRLATKLHTEEISLLKTHVLHVETQAFFSTTLCWLWGKSPDQRQRVPVVKTRVFLESLAKKRLAELDEGRTVCRSKVMQADIVAGVQLNGAYSHCVHHSFLNLQKSIASVRAPLN